MKTLKEVVTLGRNLTGLKITTKILKDTSFHITYDSKTLKIVNMSINLNGKQIEGFYYNLLDRGFNPEYLYLQALLHEFAHYKQLMKLGIKLYQNLIDDERLEDIADRFARIHYRKFLKERN